jgi:CRISPR-associated protein Cas2
MYTLIVYDITNNRIRKRVADACLDYGMQRIQKSAFLGDMNRNRQDELMVRLSKELGDKKGNIQLFPLCQTDLSQRKQLDNS